MENMELELSNSKVLTDLGLTLMQAKVYLALAKSENCNISAISKRSNVARPDVYPTLLKLEQLGVVKKIIRSPLTYRAIPLNEGLSLLLEAKTEQYKKVRAEAQLFLDLAKMQNSRKKENEEELCFSLIHKGRAVIAEINKAIEKVQLSMDLVLSWKRFSTGIASTLDENMALAWSKNVKIRFIVEHCSKNETAKQLIQYYRKKHRCQIRFSPARPATVFGIFDRKELLVPVLSDANIQDSPLFHTNCSSLITLAENHFEMLWRTAMPRAMQA